MIIWHRYVPGQGAGSGSGSKLKRNWEIKKPDYYGNKAMSSTADDIIEKSALKRGERYYNIMTASGLQKVKGTKANVDDIGAFVTGRTVNKKREYTVSHTQTGMLMGRGKTRKEAIETARTTITRIGREAFNKKSSEAIKKHGKAN
jgi:hypothetical protein